MSMSIGYVGRPYIKKGPLRFPLNKVGSNLVELGEKLGFKPQVPGERKI